MAMYEVPIICTISTTKRIEAESKEEAIQKFYDEGETDVMFLDHRYPDMGDWEVDEEYENDQEIK